MRRLKFWLKSGPDFSEHWGFKVQAALSGLQSEKLVLQDVKAMYHAGNFSFNLGQFIPEYSLQQFQPDAVIPLTERAPVIKALIPDGTLGLRDIGMEGAVHNSTKDIEAWLGVFNGYGINEYRPSGPGYMLTHKTAVHLFEKHLTAGYSMMYRKSSKLELPSVLPENQLYTGEDLRYDVFALFHTSSFEVQAEYLGARLADNKAEGCYILGKLELGKSQLVASWDQYQDLITSTENNQDIHFGYNYLIKQNNLKLMFDNRIQIRGADPQKAYSATIQCQIFFN